MNLPSDHLFTLHMQMYTCPSVHQLYTCSRYQATVSSVLAAAQPEVIEIHLELTPQMQVAVPPCSGSGSGSGSATVALQILLWDLGEK